MPETSRTPKRRDDSKGGRIRLALLDLLAEHERDGMLPTSGRFLYYELCTREVISKKDMNAANEVTRQLTYLREEGNVPWDWISDETRSFSQWNVAPSVKDWVIASISRARIDPWEGNPPVIITESRSLRGVLSHTAAHYVVPIASTNGQVGGFLHTDLAPALRSHQRVLYMGDLDFSGEQIERNVWSVLDEKVGGLEWERLAITQEQADEYSLEPISKKDNRSGKYHDAIETEALSQAVIVRILQDRLDALLPEPLDVVLEREQIESDHILSLLRERAA